MRNYISITCVRKRTEGMPNKKKTTRKTVQSLNDHRLKARNRAGSFVISPRPIYSCHESPPLRVSPSYRPLWWSLVNGGTLNPWYGVSSLDEAALQSYSPGLALVDCSKRRRGGSAYARSASPKPPPVLINGEFGLLVDGVNDGVDQHHALFNRIHEKDHFRS